MAGHGLALAVVALAPGGSLASAQERAADRRGFVEARSSAVWGTRPERARLWWGAAGSRHPSSGFQGLAGRSTGH